MVNLEATVLMAPALPSSDTMFARNVRIAGVRDGEVIERCRIQTLDCLVVRPAEIHGVRWRHEAGLQQRLRQQSLQSILRLVRDVHGAGGANARR